MSIYPITALPKFSDPMCVTSTNEKAVPNESVMRHLQAVAAIFTLPRELRKELPSPEQIQRLLTEIK